MDDIKFQQNTKPEKYKYNERVLMFPNTVLYPMELHDCNDTITGMCLKGLTLNECIDLSLKSNDSDIGYYVEIEGKDNICVPIRSAIYSTINPSFSLRNQNIYGFNDKVKITYFQDTKYFPYPPGLSGQVFYNNILTLNSYNNPKIGLTYGNDKKIYVSTDKDTNISILPNITTDNFLLRWLPVYFNRYISFNIPGSTLFMRRTQDNILKFDITSFDDTVNSTEFGDDHLFYLEPLDKSKTNEKLQWGMPFIIRTFSGATVFINNNNILSISREQEFLTKENSQFIFKSKMVYYYCDKNKCNEVEYDKTFREKGESVLKTKNSEGINTRVYAFPNCWNSCSDDKKQKTNNIKSTSSTKPQQNNNLLIIIVVGSLISIMVIMLIIFFMRKKTKIKINTKTHV
jgi:hypothetical protein